MSGEKAGVGRISCAAVRALDLILGAGGSHWSLVGRRVRAQQTAWRSAGIPLYPLFLRRRSPVGSPWILAGETRRWHGGKGRQSSAHGVRAQSKLESLRDCGSVNTRKVWAEASEVLEAGSESPELLFCLPAWLPPEPGRTGAPRHSAGPRKQTLDLKAVGLSPCSSEKANSS